MADDKQINIEIDPKASAGSYSNLAIITHSHSEFIFDFASMLPGMERPKVNDRIIMTPENALRLFTALQDNISKYESTFGKIGVMPKVNFPSGGFGGGNGAKS